MRGDMKTNITLKIHRDLLRETRVLAAEAGSSISALVARHFQQAVRATRSIRRRFALRPWWRSIWNERCASERATPRRAGALSPACARVSISNGRPLPRGTNCMANRCSSTEITWSTLHIQSQACSPAQEQAASSQRLMYTWA